MYKYICDIYIYIYIYIYKSADLTRVNGCGDTPFCLPVIGLLDYTRVVGVHKLTYVHPPFYI